MRAFDMTASGGKVYTAPADSAATLKPGWQKVPFQVPVAARPFAWALQNTVRGGLVWDKAVIPLIEAGMKAKGVNLRLPRNSVFYLNADGKVRSTPAKGYQQLVRKGYDKQSGTFWLWLVVY